MNANKVIIEKMLAYCCKALLFTEGISESDFYLNDEKQYAVCLALLQIGELVNLLPDEYKEQYPVVPWRKIKGLRNIIAHQYSTIDETLLWQVVKADLPTLKKSLQEQTQDL